ncbi:dachshund a isoform X6 [Scyliorhinus canicula]|uniref:dachshund a isoform X6 n=1 Tax=Scyliorhinus canicula TaxID=7830 RepID=UPI0018F4AD60|nr:dachshund a isoform X6 [Scyliorhinus canicula]
MAVSAPVIPPPPLTPTSAPIAGGLFRTDSVYTSPSESPKLSSSISNNNINSGNECKMVELRGVKVASFSVDGQELICLPQVFDLFLKHLVGGLHTVYTKLKRLDITPVVCTVEQVRILRGLGAIQPGVNRCKLISRKDFETLFNDCTNASSRPGRPPKRTLSVSLPENSRIMSHAVPGLLSPGIISPTVSCKRSAFQGEQLRNKAMTFSQIACNLGDKWSRKQSECNPWQMVFGKGLTAAAMAEAMKLQKLKLATMNNLHGNGSQNGTESENEELNSSTAGQPGTREGELADHDNGPSIKRSQKEKDETQLVMPTIRTSIEKFHMAGQALPPGFPAPFLFADGLSSIETLLTNIQGLLKVAVDNARVQEKQIQQEKKELKLELFREREMRETLERQLTAEQHNRATIQKRLKKEKKAKRKLQEALEFESKRREQVEQALQQATSTESLRVLNDAVIPEMEAEHCGTQLDTTAAVQDRTYMKTSILY